MKIVKPNTVVSDNRGKLIEVLLNINYKQMNHVITKKGFVRGNHYHKRTREFFYILHGKIVVTVTNIKTKKTTRFTAGPGSCFIIEPYENHTVEFIEDTEWIVLLSENFNPDNPDIYRVCEE